MSLTDLGLPTHGLVGVPTTDHEHTAKDFASDQEVRWCPGCGDYAVLAAVRSFLPELGLRKENIVFVSGIGCSSRFPYYLNTYGIHSIHGRAPAIATGLAVTRPDLSVWVVTGDGDGLSIGGNHLIHALRRNVNLKILLFNNRIYGLTKGQYSPTSTQGTVTKTSPLGSLDAPFDPVALALGAGATFVARTLDSDRAHLTEVLRAAAAHRGAAIVEIYQNCPIFNDGAFADLKNPETRDHRIMPLHHGQPVRFGPNGEHGLVRDPTTGTLEVVAVTEDNQHALVTHDAGCADPAYAYALAKLDTHTVTGVFRSVARPTYDDQTRAQTRHATDTAPADLGRLLHGRDTWTVAGAV